MPILRRGEAPDLLAPQLIHLLHKKWWIILPAVAAFLITYAAMVALPEEYQASAEVLVNQLGFTVDDRPPHPGAVAALLTSDQVMRQVRDDFARKFNTKPPVLEKFAKAFKVKTEVLQDTAMRKDVSPVVTVSVRAAGKEATQFLVQDWLAVFMREFGNYYAAEARVKADSVRRELSACEADVRAEETEQAHLSAMLPLAQKMLAEKLDLLAPAELRPSLRGQNALLEPNASNVQVVFDAPVPKAPGLIAKQTWVRVELAKARLGAATTTSAAEMEKEEAALSSVIAGLQAEIADLQTSVSAMAQRLSAANRSILLGTETMRRLGKELDALLVPASFYRESKEGEMPAGGDVRAMTAPVTPELRVWPKRTMMAGIAAVCVFMLCVGAVLLRRYLREAARAAGPETA
jgi:uncharacterized protein involved in exopolysaccharide biosynthesis